MPSAPISKPVPAQFSRAALRRLKRSWSRITRWPPVGGVGFGSLRRVKPISREFGLERGEPVDRYYIEKFLDRHAADIHGRVLEIGDDRYTKQYGGAKVAHSDVLNLTPHDPASTIVADLANADSVPSGAFDCLIVTQTLQFIYDLGTAVSHLHRILKTGGVLLATVPGISQISRYDMDRWGDFWRFTTLSARRLFQDRFLEANLTVEAYGNVLAAIAFLEGLASRELTREELDHRDADYEVLISVRAVKA
jgi:SAM-dependent methyltransferase